ncbi:hypothetical protein HI914_02375 [Erysiphe necator]|nr:hypothetical protein HI914_02375 [Erysiphe necator]
MLVAFSRFYDTLVQLINFEIACFAPSFVTGAHNTLIYVQSMKTELVVRLCRGFETIVHL